MSASSCDEEWRVPSAITDAAGADGERTEQVVLQRSVQAGALLLVVRKTALLPAAAWDTLQVGERQHARFGAKALKLNHSSTPNTRIGITPDEIHILATRPIAADEPLTFNYNTTEWRMDEPFTDWASGEEVGGFSRASEEEQRRLLQTDLPAPHIRELAARAAAAGAASHSSAEAVAALGSALLRLPGEHGPLVGATARCLCSALYASAHDGGAVALRLADALDALLRRSGGGPESEALLASLATQLDAWPASAAECAPPDGTAAGDSGLEGAALRRQIADECAAMKRVVHEENEALAAAMLARGGRQRERQAGGWQRLLVPALVVASSALVASLVGPRG